MHKNDEPQITKTRKHLPFKNSIMYVFSIFRQTWKQNLLPLAWQNKLQTKRLACAVDLWKSSNFGAYCSYLPNISTCHGWLFCASRPPVQQSRNSESKIWPFLTSMLCTKIWTKMYTATILNLATMITKSSSSQIWEPQQNQFSCQTVSTRKDWVSAISQ